MSKPKLILVVEDNPDNSQLAEKILEHQGFETVIQENSQSALSWCEENVPDLILMDISLPGMSGIELTNSLRKKEAFQNIPIIALTAHAMVGWKEKTMEAGCTDYLAKPFRPKELVSVVNKYL